jgi:hypothetical protein
MEKLLMILMAPRHYSYHTEGSPWSIITLLIFFAIPLSWVIPIVVKKTRKQAPEKKDDISRVREQIEQLKELEKLKESGTLTEEEFRAQKNKVLGREG